MKKILKFLLGLILLIVILILVAGIFAPTDYHYERKLTINQTQQNVWQNCNSLEAIAKWSPWLKDDPSVVTSYNGASGTIGSSYHWKGNDKVGEGKQIITKIIAPKRMDADLFFKTPFGESKASNYFELTPNGNTTDVEWGFDSHSPYPWNAMSLFIKMDQMMDSKFTEGLDNLKKICEAMPKDSVSK